MKIYTRNGDDGTTSTGGAKRIPKHNKLIEMLGSVDELISWLGLLRDLEETARYRPFLIYVQEQLMAITTILATGTGKSKGKGITMDKISVTSLEHEINRLDDTLPPLGKFIIPGGNIAVSYCHITRCVCRRAERNIATLTTLASDEKPPPLLGIFLNRLADYLFILSRKISLDLGIEEVEWSV